MAHAPGFLKLVDDCKKRIREVTIQQVAEKLKRGESFFFIDVREDDEWREGRAQGSMHIGKGVIERDIESDIPKKDAEIILYCGGGFRSAIAADMLQQMGYTNVASMDGGIRGWKEAGLPITKD